MIVIMKIIDETINHILSECSKLTKKKRKGLVITEWGK